MVFRHTPEALKNATPEELGMFQLRLRRMIIESGDFYLVHGVVEGVPALRVTLMNPLTTTEDLDQLLETLRSRGRELLASAG